MREAPSFSSPPLVGCLFLAPAVLSRLVRVVFPPLRDCLVVEGRRRIFKEKMEIVVVDLEPWTAIDRFWTVGGGGMED